MEKNITTEETITTETVVSEVAKETQPAQSVAKKSEMEKAFEAAGITEFETNEVRLIPSDEIELDGEKLVKFERLLDMLDEVDDVQKVHHNVKL